MHFGKSIDMKSNSGFACSLIAIAFAAASAHAGEIPIDISSLANKPWTFSGAPGGAYIYNGNTFPIGAQNFGGVPFAIPTGPNNYWNAAAAANFGSGVVSLNIPVGVYGVTSAFTLLNTFWGWAGPTAYLYVTFTGSDGATETVPLVGDVNVRDYNNDGNTNTINNTSTIQVWQNGLGQRLDRQEYVLPAAFRTQTLTSVTITDTGNQGNGTNGSRAVFSSLTVSTCLVYVAEDIGISSGPITYHSSLRLYTQEVTLTNAGTTAVDGPLFFILEDLPFGVTLVNKSGATGCFAPIGSRYVVALPEGSTLAPNTTVLVLMAFSDPSGAAITYTPLVAGSLGGLP
jgi:hypothetical protein